jgi:hypothetical protein
MLDAPSELLGPTPREIRLCGDGLIYMRIAVSFLMIAIVFGLWLSVSTFTQIQHRTALRRDGRVVVAKATTRMARGRTSVLYVRYTFVVDGAAYSAEKIVPDNLFVSVRNSDHFLVRYLPTNPAVNYPDDWEWSLPLNVGSVVFMISILAIGVGFMMLLTRERRLAREGMPTVGVVTSSALKKRAFWAEYNFSTDEMRSINGSGYFSSPQKIGASIWILYLPQNPRRNTPYPLSGCRVTGGPGSGDRIQPR